MSDPTPVDLSDLQFMPEWLKEGPREKKSGEGDPDNRRGRSSREPGDSRNKNSKGGRKNRGDFEQKGKGNRRHFDDRNKGGQRNDTGNRKRHGHQSGRGKPHDSRNRRNNRQTPTPPPEGISATLQPGQLSVTQLVEQIRKTARAYSVFDIARLVLASRERYSIAFKRDNEKSPELFACIPDQSAWLSYPEALTNLLSTSSFSEHYEEEKVQGEMPKGNYSSIAICGISNQLIGPPNHHSYQSAIAKLHRQRFSNMPIGKYKNSIRVEHDEETIERWKNEQSIEHHYTCLKTVEGEAPVKFESREDAEKHFIQEYAENLIKRTDEAIVIGDISGKNLSPGLLTLLRNVASNAQKHPASLVQPLCGMLGAEGLKFFKRGKKIFVTITRPKPLSDDSTLSKPILAIVNHIRQKKKASLKSILGALAPSAAIEEKPQASTTNTSNDEGAGTVVDSNLQEEKKQDTTEPDHKENKGGDNAPGPPREKESRQRENPEPTAEQIAVMKDLHWLLSEGAVIAFGDGHIELATPRAPSTKQEAVKSSPEKTRSVPESPPEKEGTPEPRATDNPDSSQVATGDKKAVEDPDS